jgi:hypothetical protein
VAFPVPQPTSRTRDESVNAANSHTSSTNSRVYPGRVRSYSLDLAVVDRPGTG